MAVPATPEVALWLLPLRAIVVPVWLYWLCYRHGDRTHVVLQWSATLLGARMRAGIAKLDDGVFSEGHALASDMAARVPPGIIGRRLSQKEAAALLDGLERSA